MAKRLSIGSLSLLSFVSLAGLAVPAAWAQAPAQSGAAQTTPAAQLAVIVAMPFDGRDVTTPPKKPITPMPTAAAISDALMVRPQAAKYRVLTADVFAGIARIKYRGRPADLRAMGRLLKAKVLLGGWVEATPGPEAPKPYRLTLTLYDGEGQLLGQLGYDVDTPYIDAGRFLSQSSAFLQMLDAALGLDKPAGAQRLVAVTPPAPQPTPPIVVEPPRPAAPRAVAQADDREAAPLSADDKPLVPRSKQAQDEHLRRPPWQPAFVLRAGYLYSSRALSNEGSTIGFPRSGAHGAVLHAELYPLSFWRQADALAGLGLRFTAQLPQWGDIRQQSQVGGATTGSYSATERRLEFGLRYQYNPWDLVRRPVFDLEALYGDHLFAFSNPVNLLYVSLPSAGYRYLGGQFGLSLFFTQWLGLRGTFLFSKHLSLGQMTTPGVDAMGASLSEMNGFQSYGAGNGWMWRTDWSIHAEIWRGIQASFAFFYEQNKLQFDGGGNIQRTDGMPVVRAQDEYVGVMLNLGYAFRGQREPRRQPVLPAVEWTETPAPTPAASAPPAPTQYPAPVASPPAAYPSYPPQPAR
ncbi:MAG: hypothetical protein E6Q99_04800 [Elusimicrobia bacterium]|nr:MAG: hypothetical protein E6Q99_04800 [Elusimicrobiota bacterium]